MKARIVVRNAFVVLLSIIALRAIAQDKYVANVREELFGTWVNSQNSGDIFHPQKVVVTADGYEGYSKKSDSVPLFTWALQIENKWTDSEGNIWYKVLGNGKGRYAEEPSLELYKLSKSGEVMERAFLWFPFGAGFKYAKYPTEIDSKQFSYRILYREEN
jgi:hypothetical protein